MVGSQRMMKQEPSKSESYEAMSETLFSPMFPRLGSREQQVHRLPGSGHSSPFPQTENKEISAKRDSSWKEQCPGVRYS
jgi:hypothetical protein